MSANKYPVAILRPHQQPTLEMIKADLQLNPPDQPVLRYHLEFLRNSPHYLVYLLERLRRTEKRLRHHTRKRRK
jgi:hypothetical protein